MGTLISCSFHNHDWNWLYSTTESQVTITPQGSHHHALANTSNGKVGFELTTNSIQFYVLAYWARHPWNCLIIGTFAKGPAVLVVRIRKLKMHTAPSECLGRLAVPLIAQVTGLSAGTGYAHGLPANSTVGQKYFRLCLITRCSQFHVVLFESWSLKKNYHQRLWDCSIYFTQAGASGLNQAWIYILSNILSSSHCLLLPLL